MYGEDPFMPTGSDLGGQSDTTLFGRAKMRDGHCRQMGSDLNAHI